MVLLTTSRRPTRRIRTFCRDLASSIPNTTRINRGKLSLEGVAEEAASRDLDKVIIIDRWKGGPGRIRLFMVTEEGLEEVPPRIYIRGIKLQREFGIRRRYRIRSLIIRGLNNKSDVARLSKALSDFLNIPCGGLKSIERYQAEMRIDLDELMRIRISFFLLPDMAEIGPRITISHLIWDVKCIERMRRLG